MSLRDILQPAPYLPEIEDPAEVKKKYTYWRYRIFLTMYAGYAFFYLTRKSLTFAMPALKESLGFSTYELGLLGSTLSLVYGASKFFSGILGDKSNPRYFMSTGLILTGLCNFLFGMSSVFWVFLLFWGLNGFFQGWGWPSCARLLTHWYSKSERGRWWSSWSTSQNLGGAVIPIIAAVCAQYLGWRYALYIPGVLCIVVGLALMFGLRDTPRSLGLPEVERYRQEPAAKAVQEEVVSLPVKELLFKYVLRNRPVWILAFAGFFVYVMRIAINDWSMLYLVEAKGYSSVFASFCVCWFEIGGLMGSLTAGWCSDTLFGARRNPVNILFTVGILIAMTIFWMAPISTPILDAVFQFIFGFFIFGPQMLIGMTVAEISHKKAVATSTGFAGYVAYLGAAAAGGPLGALVATWGWGSLFFTLTICGAMTLALFLSLGITATRSEKEEIAV